MVIKIYTPLQTKKNRYDSLWKPNGFCYENHNHWLICSAPNRPWLPPLDSVASHPPFLTTTFFVPSGHETWWKMAMMLDPFSSIFTQYMGFCPGICHICPRIWRYNGHRMGFKKTWVFLCVWEWRYPGIPQYGNFNAKTMINLWLLGVPILRQSPNQTWSVLASPSPPSWRTAWTRSHDSTLW